MGHRHLVLALIAFLVLAFPACGSNDDVGPLSAGSPTRSGGASGFVGASGSASAMGGSNGGAEVGTGGTSGAGTSGASGTGGADWAGDAGDAGTPDVTPDSGRADGPDGASNAGAGGASGTAGGDGATVDDTRDGDDLDASSSAEGSSPFDCLPRGDERLIIRITGSPGLQLLNLDSAQCLSRYIAASDESGGSLDLDWTIGAATVSAVVRLAAAVPGQTGTYTPFALLISQASEAWLGTAGKCHVSITASDSIGESASESVYKVTGSVACDSDWALGKPGDVLQQFDFTTRVVALR